MAESRWVIEGQWTTQSPLHVGSGDVIRRVLRLPESKVSKPSHVGSGNSIPRSDFPEKEVGQPVDIAAVVTACDKRYCSPGTDHADRPCLPGTAIKGVLRSWAERFFRGEDEKKALETIFGKGDLDVKNTKPGEKKETKAGRAEFLTAILSPRSKTEIDELAEFVPYWNEKRETGILSHVSIDRDTGAARESKLFFEEFVPVGSVFNVTICAIGLTNFEIALLLALLEQGSSHETHRFQFGANGGDGWGRMEWKLKEDGLRRWPPYKSESNEKATQAQSNVIKKDKSSLVGFAVCEPLPLSGDLKKSVKITVPDHLSLKLALEFGGPFLVNDKSRIRLRDDDDEDEIKGSPSRKPVLNDPANFMPLQSEKDKAWLPSSSFRGALRQRTEFLLRSLDPNATGDPNAALKDGPIERIFGHTGHVGRLTILEPTATSESKSRRQDFVAIDRFTGGAADGAKFDAKYVDRPSFSIPMRLDLEGIQSQDISLLLLALRDVCKGRVCFGFGGSKGYGHATGSIVGQARCGSESTLTLPNTELAFSGKPEDTPDEVWLAWLDSSLELLPEPKNEQLDEQEVEVPDAIKSPIPLASGVASTNPKPASTPELKSGRLRYHPTKRTKRELMILTKKNGEQPFQVKESEISHALRLDKTESILVEYIPDKSSQPTQVRHQGRAFEEHTATSANSTQVASTRNTFIHPYYFLTMNDRAGYVGELGDQDPLKADSKRGHARWLPNRYSGTITVRLTCETPLLLCDDEKAEKVDGHSTYPLRTQDGKPLLASSSVRGAFRAAYEAITNSRFGVFPGQISKPGSPAKPGFQTKGHGRRLGFRLPAASGIGVVPVRVINDASGELAVELLTGTSTIGKGGTPVGGHPAYAAWVGAYPRRKPKIPQGLSHGDEVWAFLTPWRHKKPPQADFNFWNVEELRAVTSTVPTTIPACNTPIWNNAFPDNSWGGKPGWRRGYLCINKRNMTNKHDERIFFFDLPAGSTTVPATPNTIVLQPDVIEQWRQLILDYQKEHAREIENGVPGPRALKNCFFSRHIVPNRLRPQKDLQPGDLCYAELEPGTTTKIAGLYPVMISRKLYPKSPLELLPPGLQPATKFEQFSPADLVFGWVNQEKKAETITNSNDKDNEAAYRSHVRFGPVECVKEVDADSTPRTLPILAQPKPQQGRFYLGRKKDGSAQPIRHTKADAGYHDQNRIRGPKVYPHHIGFPNDQQRFMEERSDQNRTVNGWVGKGTVFEFTIDVENLSKFELGGLIWLLKLPEEQGHFLRLGLGKPLGFGSVRAEIVQAEIADGFHWARSLSSWKAEPPEPLALTALIAFRDSFVHIMDKANPNLLSSFLKVAKGFDAATIQYPTLTNQDDQREHFEWFKANEKSKNSISLPDLHSDSQTLPRDL